jgi:2-polyprenyl-3-methyl-5-hydroxy-6-metoxy-1,4-benzoquinol methylase
MAQSDSTKSGTYQFGHHPAVTKIHAQRTAEKCALYLLPHIRPNNKILDVGCGPGSITLDFASLVPEGSVLGIDFSPDAISLAQSATTERSIQNCEFKIGDVMNLDFGDGEFDIVHCHQCILHLPDPIKALKEMNRVCKRGGMVAVAEADLGNMIVYPENSGLGSGLKLLREIIKCGGSEPLAGRRLKAWALEAGFVRENIEITGNAEVYSTAKEISLIGELYAGRFGAAAMGGKGIELGLISEEERANIVDAWTKWSQRDDSFFSITHTRLLYHKT